MCSMTFSAFSFTVFFRVPPVVLVMVVFALVLLPGARKSVKSLPCSNPSASSIHLCVCVHGV